MKKHIGVAAALVGLTFVLAGAQPVLDADEKSSVEEIRKELLQLPYYGVFDFLAFSYDRGTVTLLGNVYHSTLKHDAARAAKRASGVDQVIAISGVSALNVFSRSLIWVRNFESCASCFGVGSFMVGDSSSLSASAVLLRNA